MVPVKVLAILMIVGNVISALWFGVTFTPYNTYWAFALYALVLALLAIGIVRWVALLTGSLFLLVVSNTIPLVQIYAVHKGGSFAHSILLPTEKFFDRPSDLGVELTVAKSGDVFGLVYNKTDSLVRMAWVNCSVRYPSGKTIQVGYDVGVSGSLGNAFITEGHPRKVKLVHSTDIERSKVDPSLTTCKVTKTRTFPHENLPVEVKTIQTGLGVRPIISITNHGLVSLNNMIGVCTTKDGKILESKPVEVETIVARDNPNLEPGQTRYYNVDKMVDYMVSCRIISQNIQED